jgi:ketosteroid isomerase-like protein
MALERAWSDAEKANDANRLAPLLADQFVNTYDGVVSGKAEMLSAAKTAKWSSGIYDSLKVSVFGNTAIVIGVLRRKGIDKTGKRFTVNERFTDTWVRMPTGHWQCVASHGSTVSP